jgi:hypothetical protein
VAEQALPIAIHCVLAAGSFEHGVRRMVNHAGGSDSTATAASKLAADSSNSCSAMARTSAPLGSGAIGLT